MVTETTIIDGKEQTVHGQEIVSGGIILSDDTTIVIPQSALSAVESQHQAGQQVHIQNADGTSLIHAGATVITAAQHHHGQQSGHQNTQQIQHHQPQHRHYSSGTSIRRLGFSHGCGSKLLQHR